MRSKAVACVFLMAFSVCACRKAPAGQPAAATGTAGTAATPAAAPGQAGAPGQPSTPTPPKPVPAQFPDVIARVNGEVIKKEDFEKMIHSLEERNGKTIPAEGRDEILRGALDELVTYRLLSQESKSRGIKVEDAEIEAKMQEIKGQLTQDAFEKELKARGTTLDALRKDARVDLSVNKLIESEVAALPGPSDLEAKDFYEKNPDRFKQEEMVRASDIMIRVPETADAKAKAKAKAEITSVLKQAKAGADFAKLAQQHSQHESARQGGDVGYLAKKQVPASFGDVAFSLKPGEVSGIVTTPAGYHIIKVVDRKPGRVIPIEEASPQIKQFLGEQKKKQHALAFIDGLKKKSKIEVLI